MSVYQRQYQKILAAELLRYLLLGSLPNLNDISKRIGEVLSKDGNITYKYIPQASKDIFRNELYNKSLNRIKFDIDTFHEELIDLFTQALSRISYADLYHKVNSYELKKLQSQLEMLLFTVRDADFYFSGAFDTFSDISKTDTERSTKDVVDLSEQCLSLPFGAKNTRRIDLGSLINVVSAAPSVSLSTENLVSNNQIPSTRFGNIFSDDLSVWGHEIISRTNGPTSITFTFPLNLDSKAETEFFISRFEFIPHVVKKQTVNVTVSNDNVNYLSLLGYEQGVVVEDQKKTYAMDFETNLVQYVRVTLTKSEADEEIIDGNQKTYKYLFGLKKFAAFQTGRFTGATYISKPYKFDDTIGKVSIDVEQSIPPGCEINFSVASISANGIESSFIPITPTGIDSAVGSNKVVSFNSTLDSSVRFSLPTTGNDAAQVYGLPFQGKNFYRVGPSLDTPPIFGRSKLYRGFKSWYRDTTGSFEILTVQDNYVTFEHSDLEAMYALATESPSITPLPVLSSVKRVQLQTTRPPYYDSSRNHLLKPQTAIQTSSLDIKPNYAIYKILHRAPTTQQIRTFTLTSASTQALPIANFILESTIATDLPRLRLLTGQIFTLGVDYTFETVAVGGKLKPTGNIVIPTESALRDTAGNIINYLLEFVFKYDPDITHKVTSIEGTTIILSNCTNTVYDSLEITYRYIPVSPSNIIKSSIRVSDLPTTSANRTFFVEGRDYILDPGTGAIQRVPTGEIEADSSVYVQFSYRSSSSSIQTFTTWCYISSPDGIQIKFDLDPTTKKNRLTVDKEVGEAFYISTTQGLIDLTNATTSPILSNGWVQFIVRSKSPTTNAAFRTNLIDQVIQIKDVNKKKVFKENNIYFNQITAFREPLQERTVNHLKVNTLMSDHTVFAIDSTTDPLRSYIVLNFLPNTTTELYNRIPTEDADEVTPPQDNPEEFVFQWSTKIESADAPTAIVVKADLKRNADVDGAQTPKVQKYTLRVGS